jgi:hypothetical protein
MNPLVYIVTYEDWTEWEIEGVFLDKEKAVKMAKELNQRMKKAGSSAYHYNVQVWNIVEQTMEFMDLEEEV